MDLVSLDTAPDGLTQWAFDSEPRSTVGSSAFAVRYSPALGIHCVARRALMPGDPVLLEPPLVSTRTATVDGLPSAEPEWMLVHALLTAGKRRRWALQYASLAGAAPSGLEAVCSWLSEAHGVAADEPALLWQAVRGNAFGLETPLLGVESSGKLGEWPPLGSATARDPGGLLMARRRFWAALLTPEGRCCRSEPGDSTWRCRAKAAGLAVLRRRYGAGLFPWARTFNHACAPNCHSVRLGGNMALFATRAIRAGEELTHSYLPLAVLARPAALRRPHLHFPCSCARCKAEAEEAGAKGAAGGPQASTNGAAGGRLPAVAAEARLAFHVSCAAGDSASEGEGEGKG